ncbi:TatD family hydrolase [Rossellomorea aquimaris]|uniref:TatD family hydrolase n=1 Tax=Rossellomorea aquimaris TaxID=189382 RepID=UPI0007D0A6DC|nr:TatD family hydrolase [Rossellomorea aquimaris]
MSKGFLIDSHTHLDLYELNDQEKILKEMKISSVEALISVSFHLQSVKRNLDLARRDSRVKVAAGFHPEQRLPSDGELSNLQKFIQEHESEICAIGEVGLPFYLMRENSAITLSPYQELLEVFILQAKHLGKPINLHAVYEHAPIVCDLLEKHSVKNAHFHWFKGDVNTIKRVKDNGYFVSITPDVLYEEEIQQLVRLFPLEQLMVETDGPWQFEGIFKGRMTHPTWMHETIKKIAELKKQPASLVYKVIFEQTCAFYNLSTESTEI